MMKYIKEILEEFPDKLTGVAQQPCTESLFKTKSNFTQITKFKSNIFHTYIMKLMFLTKRIRPDILPGISYLLTRASRPNEVDWYKLKKILNFLKKTKEEKLTLEADNTQTINWYIDAAFVVHDDMKNHNGACMTLGKCMICIFSNKQKVNPGSSTEAELIEGDDKVSKGMRTKQFIEHQGFNVNLNVIYQDYMSSLGLEMNGMENTSKRTHHFNLKLFYITDLVKRKQIEVKYCPTDKMFADYLSKPLTGNKMRVMRQWI